MNYRPPYVYLKRIEGSAPKLVFRPGQVIDCIDPENIIRVIDVKAVPDPMHQSSLDYLKGV